MTSLDPIRHSLDSTALAKCQDKTLTRTDYTADEAHAHLNSLSRYEPFLAISAVSNLTVRSRLIQSGLNHIIRNKISTTGYAHAMGLFNGLCRNGYWVENPEYFFYTVKAFEWYARLTETPLAEQISSMSESYYDMAAPDGTIPLPECSLTPYPARVAKDYISNDSYIVKRWDSGAYLLVCVDPVMEHRDNLHVHPQCGYFALGRTHSEMLPPTEHGGLMPKYERVFRWDVKCRPYTGWDPAILADSNGLLGLLPPGAVLPTWRLKPPKVTVRHLDDGVGIVWDNGGWTPAASRRITWAGDVVRVTDRWGWFGKSVREWRVG